eukprot:TRINITY_DN121_c0_g1_i1.p2 TRINITY_DN121_c0_g1~~TRINITY_DN121_c0_g1_i1.p2  ORF type:complete len:330 (-),score=152.81 TRINITY_DN121_c0_g1_i1:117-1106(-)
MKVLSVALAVFALVAVASAYNAEYYETEFLMWMKQYGKSYSHDEFQYRFQVFSSNVDFVNNWDGSFEVGLNQFADLPNDEFVRLYTGYRKAPKANNVVVAGQLSGEEVVDASAPTTQDWRNAGAVTGVKNQGQCGGCWSFSTTGSLEGAWKLSGHTLVGLSEQNLLDCSWSYGNLGCNGGEMDSAFEYIIKNGGIDTEASYPYTAKDGSCHYSTANKGATMSKYTDVTSGSEAALQNAVGLIGPVSVAIDASHNSFQLYKSGVYYEPNCSSTKLDHGVLTVGYNTDGSSQYWIVKNSWGVTWGQQGYIWMSRNRNNNCGIATDASYPTV